MLCHNQQPDFARFVNEDTINARVNNFCRLQPSLTNLGIEGFTAPCAYAIMSGDAARTKELVYKIKVALQKLRPLKVGAEPKLCNLPLRMKKPKYDAMMYTHFEKDNY